MRDETNVNIGLSRAELLDSFVALEKRMKVRYKHLFSYAFKQYKTR